MDASEMDEVLRATQGVLTAAQHEKVTALFDCYQYISHELSRDRVALRRLQRTLFGDSREGRKTGSLAKLRAEQENNTSPDTSATTGTPPAAKDAPSSSTDTSTTSTPNQSAELRSKDKPRAPGHGRVGANAYVGAERRHIEALLPHKSPCPEDGCNGILYKQKQPKLVVRLTGSAPVTAKVWSYDWLRCNVCDLIVNAPLPPEVGDADKYDESATATIAKLRYDCGMPLNRLAQHQKSHGIPLPASTQWDLLDKGAEVLEPVYIALMRYAATGNVMYNDDTTMRILALMRESEQEKPPPETGAKKVKQRKGVFTTGLISELDDRRVALFLTGNQHAGENLATVLSHYDGGGGTVIQMSDGSPNNPAKVLPEGLAVLEANCMAHGRRKYVEIADDFPRQCLHVIDEIGRVYKHDRLTRELGLTPSERLAYHQKNSAPVMSELKTWLKKQTKDKLVEPNSSFGKATEYMMKRWDKLTLFLREAQAPLDNNICERAIKKAIRHRRNSLFYKTLRGARVGDIFMSLIHTCHLNGIDSFAYLTWILKSADQLSKNPESWLPWCLPNGAPVTEAA